MKRIALFYCFLLSFVSVFAQDAEYKAGFYDKKGKRIFSCEYEDISAMPNGLFRVQRDGKWGAVDKKGKQIIPIQNQVVRYYTHNLIVVGENDSNRVVDIRTGKEIISPKYEYIGSVSHGFAAVSQNGKWGTIDMVGNEIIPCQYGYIEPFRSGYSLAMDTITYKWGLINYEGKEILPLIYSEIQDREDLSIAVVSDGVHLGMVRPTDGKEILPCKYRELYAPEDDLIRGIIEKWGVVHITGEVIIPFEYSFVDKFSGDYTRTMKEVRWGVTDKTGRRIIPTEYEYMAHISDGMVVARKSRSSKWGAVDLNTGEATVPFEFITIGTFRNGVAPARKEEHWGVIDKTGKEIVPFEYKDLNAFAENGLALAMKDSLCGAIGYLGEEKIPFVFQQIHPFSNKAAVAMSNNKFIVINEKGKTISKEYERIESVDSHDIRKIEFKNDVVVAFRDGKKGVVNNKGKEIVPCLFDEIEFNEDGSYTVRMKVE